MNVEAKMHVAKMSNTLKITMRKITDQQFFKFKINPE